MLHELSNPHNNLRREVYDYSHLSNKKVKLGEASKSDTSLVFLPLLSARPVSVQFPLSILCQANSSDIPKGK